MKIKIGLDNFEPELYTFLVNDLSAYAPCLVTKEGRDVNVEVEGDVARCMCVVAICDRYKFEEARYE